MISHNRQAIINYRLQQARETIALVGFLIDNNQLTLSVNRVYYGMYYALSALAIRHQFETSKHAQLIGWFNKEFIATNKTDSKYGKILRNAYEKRTKGDYEVFVTFEKEEVILMKTELEHFIEAIEKLLLNNY